MSRKIIYIIITVVIAAVAFFFINAGKNKEVTELFAEVKEGPFEISVAVSGELLAERSEDIMGPMELRSPLLGYMQVKIQDLVAEGTVVDSGQYVATLDRTEASNKLKDIEDEIQKVQSQFIKVQLDSTIALREARDNLLNMKFGIEEKQIVVEQSKYEAPATIRQAKIELDKAMRAFEQAKKNYDLKVQQYTASMTEVSVNLSQVTRKREAMTKLLEKFVIYAPKSGMVIYAKDWGGNKRKVGAIISPWELKVATLPDMSSMLSKTFVNEIDISKIKKAQKVNLTLDAFPEKKFTGIVTSVANVGEQLPNSDAKVFEVMIKVLESDPVMRPAMTTSNVIQIAALPYVKYIPLEALHTSDSITYVYTKNGNKQLVLTGQSNENEIIIEKGLKKGDEIYLSVPENAGGFSMKGKELKAEILKRNLQKSGITSVDSSKNKLVSAIIEN